MVSEQIAGVHLNNRTNEQPNSEARNGVLRVEHKLLQQLDENIVSIPRRELKEIPEPLAVCRLPHAACLIMLQQKSPVRQLADRGLVYKVGGDLLSHILLCSTIGAGGLNFSVRNGKRWNPSAIATLRLQYCDILVLL